MQANDKAGGWKTKTGKEREQILATVYEAGRLGFSWKRTAGLLGVHETTLIRWRKDDDEGKLDIARATGRAEGGKEVVELMIDRAKDPDAQGSASVLIHLSKHLAGMSDKQTTTVVTPTDLAGGEDGSQAERRSQALKALGLEALDFNQEDQDDDQG